MLKLSPRADLADNADDVSSSLEIITRNLDLALVELEAGRSGEKLRTAIREAREAAQRISIIAGGDRDDPASHRPRPDWQASRGRSRGAGRSLAWPASSSWTTSRRWELLSGECSESTTSS